MHKSYFLLIVISFVFGACSSTKEAYSTSSKSVIKINNVVGFALKHEGVKYKFGGTTKRGMDCSGVIYVAFGDENFQVPRISRDMAKRGRKISLSKTQKGDLLFFKTSNSRRSINHVGLIISKKKDQIRFIHATSSRGVIISSLLEKYWKKAFVKATKVL